MVEVEGQVDIGLDSMLLLLAFFMMSFQSSTAWPRLLLKEPFDGSEAEAERLRLQAEMAAIEQRHTAELVQLALDDLVSIVESKAAAEAPLVPWWRHRRILGREARSTRHHR